MSAIRSILVAGVYHLLYAFAMPLFWWRLTHGEALANSFLANRVVTHLFETYRIPWATEEYEMTFHLISSEVEDIDAPSRAPRFQAIRNFHRAMWIISWLTFVVLAALAVLVTTVGVGNQIPLVGGPVQEPAIFRYWESRPPLFLAVGAATVGVWYLTDEYEELFVQYLFTDYVIMTTDDGSAAESP